MILLDGKKIAGEMRAEIAAQVTGLLQQNKRAPSLTAVLVGTDGASQTYVANKEKACQAAGFSSQVIRYPASTSESELLQTIAQLNADSGVDGILVQLPLPKHIDEQKIIEAIDPRKDADGFHPMNVGKMTVGLPASQPATPSGIVELLQRYAIPMSGKHCVILGRSNIVGRPLSILLSQKNTNCTVTLCHSQTQDIKAHCLQADILVAALGKPEFVTAEMVKPGAVVVDVGTTRVADANADKGYRLKGDVKFDEVAPRCSYITPVPGGVGPMTIASLLKNTMLCYLHN
ncbi:bifunctional protein FolD [Bacteroidia bacterium]|nr:bifunctional protein FolD [Bacteroidia bacterium]